MDVVKVLWADAHAGDGGWQELDDYQDDGEVLVHTVGFRVDPGQPSYKIGHITVWQSLSGRDGIHPFHIPVDMVRHIVILCCVDSLLDS
jgi:hypothetical protein